MTAFRRLNGLNAIAVADVRTGQIAAAKSGSPLVLGWSDHGHLLASDFSALLEHTRRVTFVEDRQAVLLSRERCRVFDADTGRELTPAITEVEWEAAATELSGYPDYMTKEIHEQPAVLRRLAEAGGEHARRLAAMIREAGDVFVIGCGTACHASPAAASPSPAPRSFPTWATSSARVRWWSRCPRAVRPSTSSTRCARPGSAA